jgi:hypothetical protein
MTATTAIQRVFQANVFPATLAIMLTLCTPAKAVPIPFNGGMLDGTLKYYSVAIGETNQAGGFVITGFNLGREYVLGTDFFPAVPPQFLRDRLPYSACTEGRWGSIGFPCVAQAFSDLTSPFELVAPLVDGCGPISPGFPFTFIAIVARGNCAFANKWNNAETGGAGGILVAETDPNALIGGIAFPDPFLPVLTIPFMRVTAQVEIDLRDPSDIIQDGVLLLNADSPFVEMRVSWTPDVESIPEPASLALLMIGVAAVATLRRQKSRRARTSR